MLFPAARGPPTGSSAEEERPEWFFLSPRRFIILDECLLLLAECFDLNCCCSRLEGFYGGGELNSKQ